MSRQRGLRTLLPMACDGVGPSMTCINILNGIQKAGYKTDLFATRRRIPIPGVSTVLAVPRLFSILPYNTVMRSAFERIENIFLDSLRPDDIAYLWPAASVEIHRKVHERGIPIIMEGINTRMQTAKRILDDAYKDFGLAPIHGITDARIAEEEEKYSYASTIFAPNREVERALAGTPLENSILPTSYGVHIGHASTPRLYRSGDDMTFIFCGYASIRKGIHFILDAWKHMPSGARLQIVGKVEPVILERYADILASDQVEMVGFVKDVHAYFGRADVFLMPSLEEGGPQVTYEAAIHGLPVLASPMGASRLGDDPNTMIIVDPRDADALASNLVRLATDQTLREDLGTRIRAISSRYDWNRVGKNRAEQIADKFSTITL